MASAPLNWLLKIGGATLKTTAKTLSEAVNTLHDTVTNLSTTKADASTTTTALNNLETNKLNISDLLSLEEIEASTSLTGKGVTAESIKSLNNSLTANNNKFYFDYQDGKYGYNTDPNRGADTFSPFKSGVSVLCTVENNSYNTSSKEVDLSSFLDDTKKYSSDNFLIVPKSVGYYGISTSGAGASSYNPRSGTNYVSIQYDNATGKLIVNGLCAGTTFNKGYFSYYGYIASFDVIFIP